MLVEVGMAARQLGVMGCALALLAGCPSSSGSGSAGQGGHAGHSDASVDAGSDAEDAGMVVCPDSAMKPGDFHIGATQAGDKGHITAKLHSASPDPPERYNNTWQVELVDGSGAPLDDTMITKAQAAMPFHQHAPKPATGITKLSDPGQFEVGLFLTMPGYFQLQFDVSSPSAGDDHIVFEYCLPQ
jgi:hypothetical protein